MLQRIQPPVTTHAVDFLKVREQPGRPRDAIATLRPVGDEKTSGLCIDRRQLQQRRRGRLASARSSPATRVADPYGRVGRGNDRVNVLPMPNTLSAVKSPPMPRARSRLIASPSPVPSRVRVSSTSTCTNGSNIRPS